MPRFWTHYWSNSTWEQNRGLEGDPLDHIAGNVFHRRGIHPGDFVYVVTVRQGQLILGGRLEVDRVVTRAQAEEVLGTTDLWDAEDHVLAVPQTAWTMELDRVVPVPLVGQLRFVTAKENEGLVFRSPTELDSQTLRGVRQLTAESARLLDSLIGAPQQVPSLAEQSFDPTSIEDERVRSQASVVQRLGQPEFRRLLLRAYRGRCAISGCDVEEALQAAHIMPYMGVSTNHVSNGLLLRADLHNLFDLHLLSIDPDSMTARVAPQLRTTSYGHIAGTLLALPEGEAMQASREALRGHFGEFQRRWRF